VNVTCFAPPLRASFSLSIHIDVIICIAAWCAGSGCSSRVRTRSASFLSKVLQVDDHPVKFQIWDTAGQEKCEFSLCCTCFLRSTHVRLAQTEAWLPCTTEARRSRLLCTTSHAPCRLTRFKYVLDSYAYVYVRVRICRLVVAACWSTPRWRVCTAAFVHRMRLARVDRFG
jgi:hypothetical protein